MTTRKQTMPPSTDDQDSRIFDVAKPGQTAATAQSKPVIVGHRTLLQDPMMVKPAAPEEATEGTPKPEEEPDTPLASSGKTISPPSESHTDAQNDTADSATESQPDGANIDNPAPEQTSTKKQAQKQQQEAETAQQEVLHKLVEDKKYYVSIGEKRRTRSIRRLLLGVIIGLIAVIILADLLIDAGTIKTSINPPLKIFHNSK